MPLPGRGGAGTSGGRGDPSDDDDDVYDPSAVAVLSGTGHPTRGACELTRGELVAASAPHVLPPTPSSDGGGGGLSAVAPVAVSRLLPAGPGDGTDWRPGEADSCRGLTHKAAACLLTEKGAIRSLAVNPRGSVLVSGSDDGSLCMFDFSRSIETRALRPTRVLTPFVNRISGLQAIVSVHFSCDGSYLVACQDGDCPVLVSSSGKQLGYCAMGERGMMDVVRCVGHRAPVTCSAPMVSVPLSTYYPSFRAVGGASTPEMPDLLPHPERFLTGSQDSTARVWDAGETSYTRHSLYCVKHGSGQLMDCVVVESVTGLRCLGGVGSVFATGGADGCVQVWDARVKFRPGGHVQKIFAVPGSGRSEGSAASPRDVDQLLMAEERHVGGMTELCPTVSLLAVRTGDAVRVYDLRGAATPLPSSTSPALPIPSVKRPAATAAASSSRLKVLRSVGPVSRTSAARPTAPALGKESVVARDTPEACAPVSGLPAHYDTAPLVPFVNAQRVLQRVQLSEADAVGWPDDQLVLPSLLTCTTTAGFERHVGSHLVELAWTGSGTAPTLGKGGGRLSVMQCWLQSAESNALAVAVDHAHGVMFSGLQSGEILASVLGRAERSEGGTVVVSTAAASGAPGGDASLLTWLQTRPPLVTHAGVKRCAPRDAEDSDADDGDEPHRSSTGRFRRIELY